MPVVTLQDMAVGLRHQGKGRRRGEGEKKERNSKERRILRLLSSLQKRRERNKGKRGGGAERKRVEVSCMAASPFPYRIHPYKEGTSTHLALETARWESLWQSRKRDAGSEEGKLPHAAKEQGREKLSNGLCGDPT